MSPRKTLADSDPFTRRPETSLFRRPWVAVVYLFSVGVSCVLMSFMVMPGSIYAVVVVVCITVMPTAVLLMALRSAGVEPSALSVPPFASEGATEEWEMDESGDDVDVDGGVGDTAGTECAPVDG